MSAFPSSGQVLTGPRLPGQLTALLCWEYQLGIVSRQR
jgi:hypothetical protein